MSLKSTPPNGFLPEPHCSRARLALRLERDLELNLAGVALALELMDELEYLRRELKARR